jgi:hypothetical protein
VRGAESKRRLGIEPPVMGEDKRRCSLPPLTKIENPLNYLDNKYRILCNKPNVFSNK